MKQTIRAFALPAIAITGSEEWTFIFSKNATSWGSFWYDL